MPDSDLDFRFSSFEDALSDLGINRTQSTRWISLTKVPESRWAELEELADNDNDLTLAQFYAAGNAIAHEAKRDHYRVSTPVIK